MAHDDEMACLEDLQDLSPVSDEEMQAMAVWDEVAATDEFCAVGRAQSVDLPSLSVGPVRVCDIAHDIFDRAFSGAHIPKDHKPLLVEYAHMMLQRLHESMHMDLDDLEGATKENAQLCVLHILLVRGYHVNRPWQLKRDLLFMHSYYRRLLSVFSNYELEVVVSLWEIVGMELGLPLADLNAVVDRGNSIMHDVLLAGVPLHFFAAVCMYVLLRVLPGATPVSPDRVLAAFRISRSYEYNLMREWNFAAEQCCKQLGLAPTDFCLCDTLPSYVYTS